MGQKVPAERSSEIPVRQPKLWQPDIRVRRGDGGVIYIEQADPLPAYPDRITDALVAWAERVPQQTLYAERDETGNWRRLSYGECLLQIKSLGQFLLDAKLSAERPLAILSGNSVDHALLALACMHAGIAYSAISPAYSILSKDHARLKEVIDAITPGMVYASDASQFAGAIADAVPAETPKLFSHGAARDEEHFDFAVRTKPTSAVDAAHEAITPDTIAKFLFTSGSTGSPKAVINTHRMLCANQMMCRETYAYFKDEPPILVDWSPWHHTAGGNKLFNMPFFNGGTLYIDDGNPTPQGIERTVRNLKDISPTWYFNVPRGFEALIPYFERDAQLRHNFFKDLKMIWYAGAGMAQHTWNALERLSVETIGERVIVGSGLGSTETAPAALMCTWRQDKAGNIGLPCHGISLKLVPFEDKLDARIKGPNVTPGYWKSPELTQAAFDEEGYYRYGDALRFADADDLGAGFYFDGRTAENFKLDTGTWVATGALRTSLINHFGSVVRDAAIAGADRPYLAAIVFPNIGELRALSGLGDTASVDDVFAAAPVRKMFRDKLATFARAATGSSNRVHRLILADPPPSLDSGEATDKGTINQRATLQKRGHLVEELYRGSPRVMATD